MKKIFLLAFASLCSIVIMAQIYVGRSLTPQEKLNEEYCSGLFRSYDGTIFDLLDDNNSAKSYSNILEWLQGRVAGLQVYYKPDGTPLALIRNSKASIFVDEMSVDASYLNMLPVADIAMIKIIKGPFVGAWGNGGGGVIAIYTIKGDVDEDEHSVSR